MQTTYFETNPFQGETTGYEQDRLAFGEVTEQPEPARWERFLDTFGAWLSRGWSEEDDYWTALMLVQ